MTTNQLILSETELNEIEAAEAEMHLCIEDDEGRLNVKMSKSRFAEHFIFLEKEK